MRTLIPQKRTPQGASPSGAQGNNSKVNSTRSRPLTHQAASGFEWLLVTIPDEKKRAALAAWLDSIRSLSSGGGRHEA